LNDAVIADLLARNVPLQGAYLLIVARALGLDCGPMSGFDAEKLNAAFFPDRRWQANFICTLGYGDKAELHPRNPRLDFDEACLIV
jgi:3-hydroxypropanoate dehydrogenase